MRTRAYFSLGGVAVIAALGMLMIAPKAPEEPDQVTENTWIGKLVDWQCKQVQSDKLCPVNAKTEDMGVSVDNGVLLDLDAKGDAMARETLTKAGLGGNVKVVIIGVRDGRKLAVESVEIYKETSPPVS